MGSVITCFFLEPSGEVELSLRRFCFDNSACSTGWGYHNAETTIGRSETERPMGADDFDHSDPRWPKTCGCGYTFQDSDQWQYNRTELYVRQDTGEKMTLSDAPPGAMWFAPWYKGLKDFDRSPDGNVLVVKTPAGDWNVDSKASNGPGWIRTGVPPKVTATPSILIGKYHGWLRDGQLVEC